MKSLDCINFVFPNKYVPNCHFKKETKLKSQNTLSMFWPTSLAVTVAATGKCLETEYHTSIHTRARPSLRALWQGEVFQYLGDVFAVIIDFPKYSINFNFSNSSKKEEMSHQGRLVLPNCTLGWAMHKVTNCTIFFSIYTATRCILEMSFTFSHANHQPNLKNDTAIWMKTADIAIWMKTADIAIWTKTADINIKLTIGKANFLLISA